MTTPQELEYEQPPAPEPVLVGGTVTIGHSVDVHEQPADFGAYTSLVIPAGVYNTLVLPFDRHRARAYLLCSGAGPVLIGTAAQAQASPPLGYTLTSGSTLPVMHQQAIWVASTGNAAVLSVAVERWEK